MGINRYNVAIIGTGSITRHHLSALRAIPEFNVIGIYGKDPARTEKIASDFKLKAFKDFREILLDPDIHIFDITTSSDLHAYYGMEAVKHGKNLIIEKPIDSSLEKAEELIRACSEEKCLTGVVYQQRFDQSIILLKELISKNLLGKLVSGSVIVRQKRDLAYYKNTKDSCSGVLLNNGIHYIDTAIYLTGKAPCSSHGILKTTRKELSVEDYACVIMEFDDTFSFLIDISTNVRKTLPTIFEIHGEKGSIIFWDNKIKYFSLNIPWKRIFDSKSLFKLFLAGKFKMPVNFKQGSHKDVFNNYLRALRGTESVAADGESALASLRVVHEIYRKHTVH